MLARLCEFASPRPRDGRRTMAVAPATVCARAVLLIELVVAGSGCTGRVAEGGAGGRSGAGRAAGGSGGSAGGGGSSGAGDRDGGGAVPDSGAGGTGDDAQSDGGAGAPADGDAGGNVDGADAFQLIWPNDQSAANSDPWLPAHHDEITEMRPRALVLHFANGANVIAVMARWNLMVQAFADGSTYHAYSNPTAKPFVKHQLTKFVDLTDPVPPPGWTAPNSTKMPRLSGGIDFAQLYSQTYADYFGFADPANPTHNLTLCELLRKGVINELFVAFNKTGSDGNVPEIIEYKQMYDGSDTALPGQFDPYAGNGSFDPADLPAAKACGVSLRVDFIEMTGIISGAMHVFTHNLEHWGNALPNYQKFFTDFFNMDFDKRFGTPFSDWYGIAVNGSTTNFITYTAATA